MLYAAIRQCPVFGGRLQALDTNEVMKRRGVKQAFRLGNQAVVVVADHPWRAQQAVAAMPVEWHDGEHAALDSAAIDAQLRQSLDTESGFGFRKLGDAEATLKTAAKTISADYSVPFLAHAALEPVNCVAQVVGDKVNLWVSTQVPSLVRWKAAQVADVSQEDVTVHVTLLGGGFGRRLETDMAEQAVAIAQRCGGAPVKLLWSRSEDLQHDFYRPVARARFTAALGDDGLPLAWLNRVAAPSLGLATTERLLPSVAADTPDKNHIEGAFDLPYAIPHLSVRQHRTKTPVPIGYWRSVGHSYNAFFTECFIDELAQAARRDPVAYRLALLKAHPRHAAVLKLAAEQAGWGQALPPGRARGVALHESFGSWVAQVAEVSLQDGKPRVHRVVCAIDCGSVVNPDTVKAQMEGSIVFGLTAALYGRITLKAGRVEQANLPDYPLLKLSEMPVVQVHIVPSTAAPGGVGEPGTPPIAPAVANALRVLTGQAVRSLPLVV
jgi:isoquinoline 1-oxidoreductase beta subunit